MRRAAVRAGGSNVSPLAVAWPGNPAHTRMPCRPGESRGVLPQRPLRVPGGPADAARTLVAGSIPRCPQPRDADDATPCHRLVHERPVPDSCSGLAKKCAWPARTLGEGSGRLCSPSCGAIPLAMLGHRPPGLPFVLYAHVRRQPQEPCAQGRARASGALPLPASVSPTPATASEHHEKNDHHGSHGSPPSEARTYLRLRQAAL